MVALGKNSMQTAVEEWVQSYKEDRALALLDLISFFMQCCGCEGMVTAELCQSSQGGSAAHTVTERFDQVGGSASSERPLRPAWSSRGARRTARPHVAALLPSEQRASRRFAGEDQLSSKEKLKT